MASSLVFFCVACGKMQCIGISKRQIGEAAGESNEALRELARADVQEEANGEWELSRMMAQDLGVRFLDCRQRERVSCDGCGHEVYVHDLLRGK